MTLFDSHIHTHNSPDGKFPCDVMANKAVDVGLNGISITDHYECMYFKDIYTVERVKTSVNEAIETAKRFEGKLDITAGIELGSYVFNKSNAHRLFEEVAFDYVLCSVHASQIGMKLFSNFKDCTSFAHLTKEENETFIATYFEYVLKTVSDPENDFDSLAHLTYPLRYIVAVNNQNIDISKFDGIINEILKVLIMRDKALEINTSCLATDWKYTLPNFDIVKRYFSFGGRKITIGSDAHLTDRVGLGIKETLLKLHDIGFKDYYFYKKRNPIAISLH